MPKEEHAVSNTTAHSILRRGERWQGCSERVRVKRLAWDPVAGVEGRECSSLTSALPRLAARLRFGMNPKGLGVGGKR
jgi:hypothetical protein